MMKNAVVAIKPKCTIKGKTSAEKYPDELDSAATLVTVTSFLLLGFRCLMSRFPTQENREDQSTFNLELLYNNEENDTFICCTFNTWFNCILQRIKPCSRSLFFLGSLKPQRNEELRPKFHVTHN